MLGYVSHPDCRLHDAGPLHPDTPRRLDAIEDQLIMSGLDYVLRHHDAPEVTREALERVHDAAHVERILACDTSRGPVRIDDDTVLSEGTLRAARLAAGAGVLGVDLIMRGEANPVFCAVRPPGHHATRDRAMGFCIFNNVAVAAAHAMAVHGLSRIAILDFDVHHGNGTEDIFHDDERVLFCSSFQHPFYPFTGHASEARNLVDVPLPAGTSGPAFREAIAAHWLPALERFEPQFIFVSAGFDAHAMDDMSGLALVDADYAWLGERILEVAGRHAAGRILSMLEGGYEPAVLARSVVSYIKAMLG